MLYKGESVDTTGLNFKVKATDPRVQWRDKIAHEANHVTRNRQKYPQIWIKRYQ